MDGREVDLMDEVARREDLLVQWTRDLVAIPTVNPYSGDDSAGSEAPGQEWLTQRLQEMGAQVRGVPVPVDVYERGGIIGPKGRLWDGRDNVVGEWQVGSGEGPCVLINDHMDTVGTAGMEIDPFDPVVRDGRIYGRGSSDTKGNLVMGLMAIQAVLAQARDLHGRIVFESVVDEECNGAGAGSLACCLAGVTADAALCLDGDGGSIDIGCNGVVTARVIARGAGGHGSGSGAVSALDKGMVVKEAIDAFAADHLQVFPSCPVNIGIFHCGTLPAIVPGEAELQINLNYDIRDAALAKKETGHWSGSLFRARFEQAMAELAGRDAWFAQKPAEVSWIKDMYPFWSDPSDEAIQTIVRAATQVRGQEVRAMVNPAWFDGAHLARQLGIPVAGTGFGTAGCAHAATEYAVLDELFAGARIVALALFRLLQGTR